MGQIPETNVIDNVLNTKSIIDHKLENVILSVCATRDIFILCQVCGYIYNIFLLMLLCWIFVCHIPHICNTSDVKNSTYIICHKKCYYRCVQQQKQLLVEHWIMSLIVILLNCILLGLTLKWITQNLSKHLLYVVL